MKNYFHRQIGLWGEEAQNSLKEKKILIVGSGGLGSSLAYALGSSGIGEIHVVDFDEVSIHNIHRQILFNLKDDGKKKVDVFKKNVEARYNGICVKTYCMKFEDFLKENTIKFDLILDATDNLDTRFQINEFGKKTNTSWIFSSVDSFQGQVCFIDKADFNIFPNTNLKIAPIAAPIVMFIASFEANLALRYLTNLSIKKDLLYYFDMLNGELNVKKIYL